MTGQKCQHCGEKLDDQDNWREVYTQPSYSNEPVLVKMHDDCAEERVTQFADP